MSHTWRFYFWRPLEDTAPQTNILLLRRTFAFARQRPSLALWEGRNKLIIVDLNGGGKALFSWTSWPNLISPPLYIVVTFKPVIHFHRIGPLGRFNHRVAMSVVCVSVCVSLFMYYILRLILPPLPEVGCPKYLGIRNPWGKVLERSGLRIEHFCWEVV